MPTIALIPGLLVAVLSATLTDEAIQGAVDRVYRSDRYQTELPENPAPEAPPDETPQPSAPSSSGPPRPGPGGGSGGREAGPPGASDALGPAVRFLLWTSLAVILILLAVWAASEWAPFWPGGPRSKARARGGKKVAVPAATVTKIESPPKPEHERYADEGRYADAVHALLLAVQWEIDRRRSRPFPPSVTSREILRAAGIAGAPRDALASLVTTVEASLFGGAEVGRPGYEACAGSYRAVLTALPEARP